MIDAKSFMEFFEKEYDVSFVDVNTGKRALDIIAINEQEKSALKKSCMTCKWVMNGDGKSLHGEDTICMNDDSEYVTDWVSENIVCNLWKRRG